VNYFTDAHDELRLHVRRFLEKEVAPHLEEWEKTTFPDSIMKRFGELGFLGLRYPQEYGGQGGDYFTAVVLSEEMARAHCGGLGMAVAVQSEMATPPVHRFGTEEQKRRFLPAIAGGEMQWAQLFSEPGAGSDLASLATSAIPDGEHFVVNGSKIWISYADIAHYGFLVARSVPGSRRREGLSVLLVDMRTPGIEVRPIRTPLGPHKLHEVFFDDAIVPRDALLGPLHEGWDVATTALSFERSGSARYARSTRILGLLDRLDVDEGELAEALAFGRAAELINYNVVAVKESGAVPTWESSAMRVYNALYEKEVASLAERALGPLAMVSVDDEHATERGEIEAFIRAAPTASVTAGTYEIQMGIIAQRGLGLERSR
jgi:alkylation response protein AidB-like acyl-CoA dehydrogenase